MKVKKRLPEIENRKAYHEYEILEKLECGIELRGNEVKSIVAGSANITSAWVTIQDGNLVVRNMHVTKYECANAFDVDERRERQLLAHKREIRKLAGQIAEKGVTMVPLKIYFTNGKCKLLIGVGTGKHNYDKRAALKKAQATREVARELKQH